MKREVETQVKIKNVRVLERKLKKISKYLGKRKQTDKYFTPANNNYFEKDPPKEYLRIRNEKDREIFGYFSLNFDKRDRYNLISTDEYEMKINNPLLLEKILKKIGLVHRLTVVKERKYFKCGNFIVTIDKVKSLGNFIEVEAKKIIKNSEHTLKLINNFLKNLNIIFQPYNKEIGGYPRMFYNKLKRNKKIK